MAMSSRSCAASRAARRPSNCCTSSRTLTSTRRCEATRVRSGSTRCLAGIPLSPGATPSSSSSRALTTTLLAGSTPRPRSDSSGSSTSVSTSTASYDARDRRVMPPPAQLQHSMHSAARSSRSHHHRPPPSASAVAPPLPGYGPPRTRADAVRSAPAASQQRQRPPPSERSYSSGSSSSSSRCADDDVFHPAHASVPPSVRSHVRGAVPARVAPPRSVAGSSIAAGAGALPPLTAGNLRAVASRAPSVAAVPLRASTPALARARPRSPRPDHHLPQRRARFRLRLRRSLTPRSSESSSRSRRCTSGSLCSRAAAPAAGCLHLVGRAARPWPSLRKRSAASLRPYTSGDARPPPRLARPVSPSALARQHSISAHRSPRSCGASSLACS